MRLVYDITLAGYRIQLWQRNTFTFDVSYGAQVDELLTRVEAAHKLGEAIMHALECEGKLD